jgi:hypothetical protein
MTLNDGNRLVGAVRYRLQAPGTEHHRVAVPKQEPGTRAARPIVLPAMVGAPRHEISRLVRKVVVGFAIDDSGSMYAKWGDDDGVRYAAAQSLLGLMRRSGGGRASVLHWGSMPGEQTPLLDVRRGAKKLDRAMRIPLSLGGNNLPAALQAVGEQLGSPAADEVPLVFVITDGIEEVTTAMHDAVRALPAGCVHMLLVDKSCGCNAAMEAAWQTVAFGSFVRLSSFDTSRMAFELAGIFAATLGLGMPAPRQSAKSVPPTKSRTTERKVA